MGDTTTEVKKTDMEAFRETPYYQTLGIDKLQQQLGNYSTDDATLRQQAEALYNPTYTTELEALRQSLALQTQSYESQLAGLGTAYEQQRRRTNQAYNESAVDLNNALTKRGLGRSSLVSTQGAYLENQRNQALSDVDANEMADIKAIRDRIALLNEQTAQSEKTLSQNYAQQIEARISELRQQNQTAMTNLQLQIATLQMQGYQAYQQQLLAEREQKLAEDQFEYTKSKKSSSGSSSSGNTYTPPATQNPSSDNLLGDLMGDGVKNASVIGSVTASLLAGVLAGNNKNTTTNNSKPTSLNLLAQTRK